MSNPIDPRESADTANVAETNRTDTANTVDAPDAEDIGTNTTETHTAPAGNGHPVTSTIFRMDGDAYFANDTAKGGTWAYSGTLTRSFTGGNWDGRIRASFAPRTDKEAANPQGSLAIQPIIMEAVFYGSFREAHGIMRAAIAVVARRREAAKAAKIRRRKAAKAAKNAPEGVDAANTSPEDAERF